MVTWISTGTREDYELLYKQGVNFHVSESKCDRKVDPHSKFMSIYSGTTIYVVWLSSLAFVMASGGLALTLSALLLGRSGGDASSCRGGEYLRLQATAQ